jgi:hypothetical protein
MAIKTLYLKSIGGNVGNTNLITSAGYKYDEETFEFKGMFESFDGGKAAKEEGHYTFESIKAFIESKGVQPLVKLNN